MFGFAIAPRLYAGCACAGKGAGRTRVLTVARRARIWDVMRPLRAPVLLLVTVPTLVLPQPQALAAKARCRTLCASDIADCVAACRALVGACKQTQCAALTRPAARACARGCRHRCHRECRAPILAACRA